MALVGFLTFGLTQVLCSRPPLSFHTIGEGYIIVHGWAYLLASWNQHPPIPNSNETHLNVIYEPILASRKDASFLFQNMQGGCSDVIVPREPQLAYFPCQLFDHQFIPSAMTFNDHTSCHNVKKTSKFFEDLREHGILNSEGNYDKGGRVSYYWNDINTTSHLAVYNNYVLNLNLLSALPQSLFVLPHEGLIESILKNVSIFGGQDITHTVYRNTTWKQEAECLLEIIKVGEMDTENFGCLVSDVILYTSLIVILGVILIKFGLAVIFGWFLSWKLGNFKPQSYKDRMQRDRDIEDWTKNMQVAVTNPYLDLAIHKKRTIMPRKSRFTLPDTGSMHFNADRTTTSIWKHANSSRIFANGSGILTLRPTLSTTEFSVSQNNSRQSTDTSNSQQTTHCPYGISSFVPQLTPITATANSSSTTTTTTTNLAHTICLVTCYSEGEEGLRTTLDSIATTDFPNSHKLILVIADGLIIGHGNALSTPDICLSLMSNFLVDPAKVEAASYVAIADGTKRHNMAKIYAGFYKQVPMLTIVKCGTASEESEAKPGNRGKRDSQVILMSFLQKVMFDERMTALEYEMFVNWWRITGVSPDRYEIVLMVDADTKIYTDSLSKLVSCMVNDPDVMGLCGETKIGNKCDSWVSMIQVFEYYISHHQSKAFESIFGGVTCLPGCFCMYRIKAPKGTQGHWVPILANPDIIERYSENVVDTLHKKNLLLLGEDRYLSTLMLKTFPRRKMLFVPQAVCKTVVPDTFTVLLSQRRRWINSTIHNLMELVLVKDLCGTFCFSMQFVVFMELVGTLALPAAISFTMYLIVLAILGEPAILSLILLALILGLPAVLIVMTSRKWVYVGWMVIYLFSLPVWNFVLPVYAYWHFDDFTWGETRKVEGDTNKGHGDKEGEFDSSQITMKKWSEFERERKLKEAEERSRAMFKEMVAAAPTRLSFELDRSTLTTLIESSLGTIQNSSSQEESLDNEIWQWRKSLDVMSSTNDSWKQSILDTIQK
ncbi:chitin synthase-domain-containing protein [Cokeromyces recurvatus]|uniref:chitin synthase-domain-containing protein n=1 Tax=Cokeromyces recurvatus TaxID=90255 RepID=UPI00221F52DA|nr:chitin synthase-domain-containing protein [Cokeromyces recurvatus]KAI7897590.1 chitin synthase-domain-containing protein [Cokeromyces recurvatus]